MPNELLLINDVAKEVNKLHDEIISALSSTIPKAIRAGDYLNSIKEKMDHGKFLIWIKDNCKFKQSAAYNYMKIAQYKNKLQNYTACGNLQEAYKQIESLEAVERRKEDERKQALIRERIKTGVKPEGWDRSLDYEYNKRIEQGGYAKIKDDFEWPKSEKQEPASSDMLKQATDIFFEHQDKIKSFKEKIRLSDSGKDDAFIDAIMEYIDGLESDNRRIETCNNIIKVCRNISVELQKEGMVNKESEE